MVKVTYALYIHLKYTSFSEVLNISITSQCITHLLESWTTRNLHISLAMKRLPTNLHLYSDTHTKRQWWGTGKCSCQQMRLWVIYPELCNEESGRAFQCCTGSPQKLHPVQYQQQGWPNSLYQGVMLPHIVPKLVKFVFRVLHLSLKGTFISKVNSNTIRSVVSAFPV